MRDSRLLRAEQLDDIVTGHFGCDDAASEDVRTLYMHIEGLEHALRVIRDTYRLSSVRGRGLAARLAEIADQAIGGDGD